MNYPVVFGDLNADSTDYENLWGIHISNIEIEEGNYSWTSETIIKRLKGGVDAN